MTKTDITKSRPKVPAGRKGKVADDHDRNAATVDEFEREGLGIAAKE